MAGLTALVAGTGALPAALAAAMQAEGRPFLVAEMEGFPAAVPGADPIRFRIERLVPFLDTLQDRGVTEVVFAGAVRRPRIEPELFDARSATLVPRILAALPAGDDALLRTVAAIFEDWDLPVVGAHSVAPALVPGPGLLAGAPSEADRADATRAAALLAALGPLDIGQGAVVAQGLCLAIETLPGTDAMLDFVATHAAGLRPNPSGARGLLYKAPKPGQDRRMDLPTLGPGTVAAASAAGLAGIVWEAGGALLVDRAATVAAAQAAGLFLWSRDPAEAPEAPS
jgi:DUF1009 family protein